jgi:hypothetical protein
MGLGFVDVEGAFELFVMGFIGGFDVTEGDGGEFGVKDVFWAGLFFSTVAFPSSSSAGSPTIAIKAYRLAYVMADPMLCIVLLSRSKSKLEDMNCPDEWRRVVSIFES